MLTNVRSYLFAVLNKRRDFPDEELNRYMLIMAVALSAAGVHALFAVFFLVMGATALGVSHCIGLLVFILAFFLLQRKHYNLAGVLIAIMIVISSMATIYVIGGDNFSILYQMLVLIMLTVVPFTNRHIAHAAAIIMPLLMLASYLLDVYHVPTDSIGGANMLLSVANIIIVSSGTVVMLSLEQYVRKFVNTFHQQRFQELMDQAHLDPLTNLYNRRYADAYFDLLKGEPPSRDICVAICDLDDFKRVNDTYGHDAGDTVLRAISQTLLSKLRKSDIVFRWGGEEFLLVINDATPQDTYRILDNVRRIIECEKITYKDVEISITITIGIAKLDPQNIQCSLEQCDKKLYEGKQNGKNRVVA